jgi:UDP-N-acetylglucosamine acyltransferase
MSNSLSYIHPEAKIGKDVTIEPFAYIAKDVTIGNGCWIGPNSVILDGARIGEKCLSASLQRLTGVLKPRQLHGLEMIA